MAKPGFLFAVIVVGMVALLCVAMFGGSKRVGGRLTCRMMPVPKETCPKILWMHWQQDVPACAQAVDSSSRAEKKLECAGMSPVVRNNVARAKALLEPLGWKVVVLDDESCETMTMVDDVRREAGWSRLGVQAKSDYLRLKLLTEYGGLWMDAGIHLNPEGAQEIDSMHARVSRPVGPEAVLFTLGDVAEGIPYVESWFMLAGRNSTLMNLWKQEFTTAIRMGFDEYGSLLQRQGVKLDRMGTYLTVHRCVSRVIQTVPPYNVRLQQLVELHESEKDMFAAHVAAKWDQVELARHLIDHISTYKYCKLRGDDRKAVESNPTALSCLLSAQI